MGPSGIGKTALLRAVANDDLPRTTPDGVVAVPAQLGIGDTLNYVFDACYEGTRRMVPRREELSSALAGLRLLVVLDDPDVGRDLLDQLRQALPVSLFLLSAHERRIFSDVDGVVLGGLPDEEALDLIAASVGRALTDRERDVGRRVAQVLGGTPLELVRFASLVRSEADADVVAVARGFGVDAEPADVLVAARRATSADETAVLQALAAFGAPVGAGLVASMSGRRDAGELLLGLAARGLVGGDDLQGWWSRDGIAAEPEEQRRAALVLTGWIRERTLPEEVAAEIPAITAVLAASAAAARWDDVIALAAVAERPLALASRWSAWDLVLQAGRRAAGHAQDLASERFFVHQLEVMRSALAPTPVPSPVTTPPTQPATRRPSSRPTQRPPSQAPPRRGPPRTPAPSPRRPRGRWVGWVIGLVAVALLGGGLWLGRDAVPGEEPAPPVPAETRGEPDPAGPTDDKTEEPVGCTVPIFVGLSIQEARDLAVSEDVILEERMVEAGAAPWEVVSQDPAAGTRVECGSIVSVEWSGVL